MKKLYNLLILLLIGLGSFAQPYYVYTAVRSGMWNDVTVWNIVLRTDGVPKNKVVIPAAYTITADNGVNGAGLGNVEIEVMGRIQMAANATIDFNNNSSIRLFGSGNVNGSNNNQRIRIGGVVKYNGSLDGLKTGASIADNLSGVSPNGFRLFALPVTFSNFYLTSANNEIIINWSTASESNSNRFEIERSIDGNEWSVIATVQGAGNSNTTKNYSYADKNNKYSISYYRIKQVDNDGRFTYTAVRSIKIEGTGDNTDIFSGANKNIVIRFDQVKSKVSVRVMNLNGQTMSQQSFQQSAYISFQLGNAVAGIYVVQVVEENGKIESRKVAF